MRRTLVFLLLPLLLLACDENPVEEPLTPNFELTDTQGNLFRLSNTEGKVVILNFFRSDCATCQAEAPDLSALHDQYSKEGLVIVGITMDGQAVASSFRQALGLNYRLLLDNGAVTNGYGVTTVPTNVVINREGKIYGLYGPLEKSQFEALLLELL